jgi:hypothetical protein
VTHGALGAALTRKRIVTPSEIITKVCLCDSVEPAGILCQVQTHDLLEATLAIQLWKGGGVEGEERRACSLHPYLPSCAIHMQLLNEEEARDCRDALAKVTMFILASSIGCLERFCTW